MAKPEVVVLGQWHRGVLVSVATAMATLAAPVLTAQNLPDRLGVGTPPPGTVATVDEAHAVNVNPAGLGFVDGPQAMVAHSGVDFLAPTGASDSVYGAVRLFGRLGVGASVDWIRPPASFFGLPNLSPGTEPLPPLFDSSVVRLSLAGALRLSDEISVGAAYRHLMGTRRELYNLGTMDAGVMLRPARLLAVGAALEQANSPFAGDARLQRSVRMGLAVRPLWEKITLSAEVRLDEYLRIDHNFLARLELLPGMSLMANAYWLDMLNGSSQAAAETVRERQFSSVPFLSDRAKGVGVPSLERIGFGVGFQLDMEHFGGGALATWTPGPGFLVPAFGRVPNPLTGGFGTLGGATVYGRASMERYPSLMKSGARAIVVQVEGELGPPAPENPVDRLASMVLPLEEPGEVVAQLDRAVRDSRVQVVLLRIRGIKAGWGRIMEVRQRVEALRAAKKRVVAFMESGGDEEYHVASAADRIYLMPSGVLQLDGFAVIMQFFAAALDRVGVHVEAVAAGKYKSAPEQVTRTGPSEDNLEIQRAILDGLYNTHVSTISRNRGLPADKVRDLVDRGIFTAKEALDEKLVDGLAYEDEIEEVAAKDLKTGSLSFNDRYGREEIRRWRWAPPKAIAVVPLEGTIKQGKTGPGGPDLFGLTGGTGADDVVAALEAAGEDGDVKAVVLRVESPGGDSLASDIIWNAVRKLRKKKPVIASFGDVAASGGYYAACGADLILAEPTTLTGSIGVFSMSFEVKDLLDRFGVNIYEETRGKLAGGGWHRPMTAEERATAERFVGVTYETFLDRVKSGRRMSDAKVREVAQGRVWTGAQAQEVGLVDRMGGLVDAIELAKARVGLQGDNSVAVKIITGKEDPISRWGSALNVTAGFFTGEQRRQKQMRDAAGLLFGDPAVLEQAQLARDGRVMALMPYTVRIK